MATLPETQSFDAGIYQIETSDPVQGGPGGIANQQATQLANRTAWLKKQIDDAVSGALTLMYANQLKVGRTLTMSGDGSWSVTFDGSGNVSGVMALAASGITAGTYPVITVDAKGRATAGRTLLAADIPALDYSKITTGKPTTLTGYGITDGQPLDADLSAVAALASNGLIARTGAGTAAARTLSAGSGISVSNGDGVAGNPTISNSGVTSLAGTANQVTVSAATGGITLSLPQAIHSAAKPSFAQVALAADPTSALDAATKQYVDNLAAGLEVKASVRAATTANITLSGTQTVDGVALLAADRVLVKNQTTPAQNGLYIVAAGAWTRTTDTDAWSELVSAFVFVEQGTSNADSGWVCTVDPGGTLGTTSVSWTQFAGAGTITAGSGITVSGNQVALAASGVTAGSYAKLTVDSYGRATFGTALVASDIPPLDYSKISTGKPTTLAGYGISDALLASSYTAADVLTKLKEVDGAASGLDADLLDGQDGNYYLNWNNFSNKPTTLATAGITDVLVALSVSQQWTAAQRGAVSALAYAATISVDLSLSNNFSLPLTGSATLGTPVNAEAGQSGIIAVTQDATGSRLLAFGANWKFASGIAPVLSTAANAVDYLAYYVETPTRIYVSRVRDVK